MRCRNVFLVVGFCLVLAIPIPAQIFSDGFESGSLAGWTVGEILLAGGTAGEMGLQIDNTNARTGTRCVWAGKVADAGDDVEIYMSRVVPCAGQNVSIVVWMKQGAFLFETADYFEISYRTSPSSPWVRRQWTENVTLTYQQFIVNAGAGSATFEIRFLFCNSATDEDYYIDDVAVLGTANGRVTRTLPAAGFTGGVPMPVRLTAGPIAGGAMTVREGIPAGWGTPAITPPSVGTAAFAGSIITWTLTLGATTATLDYTTLPPAACDPKTYTWSGDYDAGTGWLNVPIGGNTVVNRAGDGWQNAILPWTNAMWISAETPVGGVDYYACDDSYQFHAAGHDIWDNADDFEFLYANVTGDFMIQARVDLQTVPNTWTKAGLMARTNNSRGSPFVDMMVSNTGPGLTGDRQLCFQWRDTQDGGCGEPATNPRAANNGPADLRLSRAGSNVIVGGYDNIEGVVNWTFNNHAAANIPTATPIIVGLALTSHVTGVEARARFYQITRTGNFPQPVTPPAAPTGLSAVSMASKGFLSWTDNSNNETGFKIERKTAATAYVEIAQQGANSTTYLDSTVVVGTAYTYHVRSFNAAGDSAFSNEATVTIVQALGARHWQLYEK